MATMLAGMLQRDRRRRGFTVGQVAWRLGVSPQEYRELEADAILPTFDTWDRICKLYGWSQSFVGQRPSRGSTSPPAPAPRWRRTHPRPDAVDAGAP